MQPVTSLSIAHRASPELRRTRLERFLSRRTVRTALQPMLDLRTTEIVGYELLCRARCHGIETSPRQFFAIADARGLAGDLSRHLNQNGLEQVAETIGSTRIFLNIHPAEHRDPRGSVTAMAQLSRRHPRLKLAVEIHEESRLELDAYQRFQDSLRELGIGIAFDDFGVGRSRLLELATGPPDYVKFARRMVRGLHRRDRCRCEMLARLVDFTRSLGAIPIAEGIETQEELAACRRAGFDWAQGFYLGPPRVVSPELEIYCLTT